jgi:hypothetical protein
MNHFPTSKSVSMTTSQPTTQPMVLAYSEEATEELSLEGFEPLAELADSLEQAELDAMKSSAPPSWDRAHRVLVFAGQVIKRFNWPARNQELILTAFEEMGWPDRIDDPLPITEGISQKDRLHDTIKCLNRKRIIKSIRFAGDGTGQGVCWRPSDEAERKTV